MIEKGIGYLVDPSHSPLIVAAVRGVGEVLEHRLRNLERSGRDVSPIINESRHRLVAVNIYEPHPVMIQMVQHEGQLERMTEIIGIGIGLGVLREVRRAARILDVEPAALTQRFRNRVAKEKAAYGETYELLKGDAARKRAEFANVLRELQEKYRRDAGETRPDSESLFRSTLPTALRELERSIGHVLSGSRERPLLAHVVEVASAIANACREPGLAPLGGVARSIAFLVSVSPDKLQAVESAFREKLMELQASLTGVAGEALSGIA
jgi:hypothetical protein